MSHQLIARNPDLQRLRTDGLHVLARLGYLLIKDVPYVSSSREIKRGTLISRLELANDVTQPPAEHVAYWTGEHPCHSDGSQIFAFSNPSGPQDLGEGIRADFTFSAKAAYRDYHHKMSTYLARIIGEARKVDPNVLVNTNPLYLPDDETSVFKYEDTASSRVNIGVMNQKLIGQRIGIVGLGGTGAYVLDFISKTHVSEIHLFDGDVFLQHNAFRAPGAAEGKQLALAMKKVSYWSEKYSAMRHGIFAHAHFMDEEYLDKLQVLDFAFLCMDPSPAKVKLITALEQLEINFIDVGLGVLRYGGDRLGGLLRVTTSTPHQRVTARAHAIGQGGQDAPNDYATNIQVVELNALNAAMAVIRWKKLFGYYHDTSSDHECLYMIASNEIVNSPRSDSQ